MNVFATEKRQNCISFWLYICGAMTRISSRITSLWRQNDVISVEIRVIAPHMLNPKNYNFDFMQFGLGLAPSILFVDKHLPVPAHCTRTWTYAWFCKRILSFNFSIEGLPTSSVKKQFLKYFINKFIKTIIPRYVQDWTLMRFKFLMISITVSSLVKRHQKHIQFCQIWSNMKMSNNSTKYEVLITQYLGSILDISGNCTSCFGECNFSSLKTLQEQIDSNLNMKKFA